MQKIGEKIFDHLQVIEYYRYLKEYDESFESILRYPNPLQVKGEEDPVLSIRFIKSWEKKYAKSHTENWRLEVLKSGKITRTKFSELYSINRIEEEPEERFGRPFFQVFYFFGILGVLHQYNKILDILLLWFI